MRLKEFATILEYRRDVTANKMGPQLIASAQKDQFFAASTDLSDPAQAADMILAKLEAMDPTRNQQYVTWLAKQYINGQFMLEDQPAVHQTLADYTKLKPRLNPNQRDINRLDYHTTVELVDRILNPSLGGVQQGTFPEVPDSDVMYNGPLGQLAVPKTKKASCELGSGTKWCTASTTSMNMFNNYFTNGDLYVWRDRNGEKFQFFIPDDVNGRFEFKNSRNRSIPKAKFTEFRTQHPVLKQLFQQIEAKVIQNPRNALEYTKHRGRWPEAEHMFINDRDVALTYAVEGIRGPWPEGEHLFVDHLPSILKYTKVRRRWPEVEDLILSDTAAAYTYAIDALKRRWPAAEAQILQHPVYGVNYAFHFYRKNVNWPEALALITKDPKTAYRYAKYRVGGPWPPGEAAIKKDPHLAVEYAKNVIKGPWPEGSMSILNSTPMNMCVYAMTVLKKRWPLAEPMIAKHAGAAAQYARYVIKGRWRAGEPAIKQNPLDATDYAARVLKRRWPSAEPMIKKSFANVDYAKRVVKGPWPEAERFIKNDPDHALRYAMEVLKKPWPAGEPAIAQKKYTLEYYKKFVNDWNKRNPGGQS